MENENMENQIQSKQAWELSHYGSGNTQYRLEHYLDLLERKPRSVEYKKLLRPKLQKYDLLKLIVVS